MNLRALIAVAMASGLLPAHALPPGPPQGAIQFTVNNEVPPRSLDPARMSSAAERRLFMALFEGLTVPDPRTGLPSPGLARSWTASADLKTYTYRLRPATWSDGKPITANDVVRSWLRALASETRTAGGGRRKGAG